GRRAPTARSAAAALAWADRDGHLRNSAGAVAGGGAAHFQRCHRRGRAGPRVFALQLLRDLAVAGAKARADSAAGGLDAAELSARERVAVHPERISGVREFNSGVAGG